jgi:hypothetical protein
MIQVTINSCKTGKCGGAPTSNPRPRPMPRPKGK